MHTCAYTVAVKCRLQVYIMYVIFTLLYMCMSSSIMLNLLNLSVCYLMIHVSVWFLVDVRDTKWYQSYQVLCLGRKLCKQNQPNQVHVKTTQHVNVHGTQTVFF